jgi:serine/threonine-protein kinase SRPK3
MVEYISPFSSSFLAGCKRRQEFFDENGRLTVFLYHSRSILHIGDLLQVKGFQRTRMEDLLRSLGVEEKEDILGSANFILRCLTIDPSLRPSAAALLEDVWLKDA